MLNQGKLKKYEDRIEAGQDPMDSRERSIAWRHYSRMVKAQLERAGYGASCDHEIRGFFEYGDTVRECVELIHDIELLVAD